MFYLKPPRGVIQREKMVDLARKRLKILGACREAESYSELLENHLAECESVAEGTAKDRIAHFALVLAAAARSDGGGFAKFVSDGEARLFRLRSRDLDAHSLANMLEELQRHMREGLLRRLSPHTDAETLEVVSEILDSGILFQTTEDDEEKTTVLVPFYLVPSLVRGRWVEVSGGRALITREQVPELLTEIFRLSLEESLRPGKADEDDPGTTDLSEAVYQDYLTIGDTADLPNWGRTVLRAEKVAEASLLFPPCMRRLQRTLHRRHRLRHHDRVAYTLFLKDAGMPLEQALDFWRFHYSQGEGSSDSCCGHTWEKDGRRYEYSIQHLYGRRGACKDYSSHSCLSVQDSSGGPGSQLLCPFKELSPEELRRDLAESYPGRNVSHDGYDRRSEGQEERLSACKERCASFMLRGGQAQQFRKPSDLYLLQRSLGSS